ncbi:hypothetical protein EVJ58_g4321 [Rhodofomes roseus]|uniref:Uncharacterized protein n=1 Tax=Rhodofomes roseus TaxID=34475 RepID=A0A4Y9YHA2_9APHY|nr:hypothetical protein EVJ58_g4321 [Rhodofomes roseus]
MEQLQRQHHLVHVAHDGTGNASVLVSVNLSVAFAVYMGTSSVDNTYLVDIDPAPTAHVLADSSEAY